MNAFLPASLICLFGAASALAAPLRVATFAIEATPPAGSPLCNGSVAPAKTVVTPLMAKGVVLSGSGAPLVLCAFDWVGIGNESHDAFRAALAEAVGTSPERVVVHTLHQHDAPGSDFATERLLAEQGLAGRFSNADFDREVMARLAAAAKECLGRSVEATHLGLGTGTVERVASNRRILGPDGKVALQRQSSGGKNPAARDAPEGTIDPELRLVAFWNGETPLAVLSYYATHPMSYYGRGLVNWDLIGMAREDQSEARGGLPWIHFNGAGGNVAAGKYNDGSEANRPILAERVETGMRRAWESQVKQTLTAEEVGWAVEPVAFPVRETLVEETLLEKLADRSLQDPDRIRAARDLVFLRRVRDGHRIGIACLTLGEARILHLPGELFVEYQLAAAAMRPGKFTAMAAYGDYGTGYIGTAVSYGQGGYETGPVSRVGPGSEAVLMEAMKRLLDPAP
jgi:hypothetical protein